MPDVWVEGFRILNYSWITFVCNEYIFSGSYVVATLRLLNYRNVSMALTLLVLGQSFCNFILISHFCVVHSATYFVFWWEWKCVSEHLICFVISLKAYSYVSDFLFMCWNSAASLQVRLKQCCVRQKHRNEFCKYKCFFPACIVL